MENYKIIDLSIWMDSFTFPGNPKWKINGPFNRVTGSNPEYVYDFELCTQSGTHIQGSHYFSEYGRKINDYPLSSFEGEAFIVDIDKRGTDITRSELENLLTNVELEGCILILRTGHMDELIKDNDINPLNRPGISLDAAKYLCEEKKIKMIAIDSIGLESRTSKNYEVNTYLCSKGILILECITNLNEIKSGNVFIEAFPLKINGVEGTSCRAIAKEYF